MESTEIITGLKQMIRSTSHSRFDSHTKQTETDIVDPPPSNGLRVHGGWMCMILIAGQGIRVNFKVHFSCRDIGVVIHKVYGKPIQEITEEFRKDYVREYCNLVAGGIKKKLEECEISAGISLPIITRGFDEIFFGFNNKDQIADFFAVGNNELKLVHTPMIQIQNPKTLDKLVFSETAEDEEEIDFL